ncbi:major facilitator superfamily domain-containing protein [Aspergillus floccosus]
MDFQAAEEEHGSPFNDFHRADLHRVLLDRAVQLDATVYTKCEVVDMRFDEVTSTAIVVIRDQPEQVADLVIGADGINSRCREILLGRKELPYRTGDMAYRILLDAAEIRKDSELRTIVDNKAVNYWYGPGAHVVTYPLRDASLLNMVLLVPDNMPEDGPSTLQGYVDEMQGLIGKLLAMCPSVLRWRLCIRKSIDSWVHPSGCFALLGDAAHATLPYLASGAGITFEDAAVLGECLDRIRFKTTQEKKKALETVVERGTIQQDLNHLDDGIEQEERDRTMRAFEAVERDWQAGKRGPLPSGLKPGEDPLVWRRYGVGEWLFGGHGVIDTNAYLDPAAERSYVRKVDLILLPLLSIMYFCRFMTGGNIGNAKTGGIERDLGMVGEQYSMMMTLVNIPFVVVEPFVTLMVKKYGGHLVIPSLILISGVISLCQVAVRNYAGLLTCRMLIACSHSGFFSSVVFYMTLFYKRNEMAFRIAIFYGSATIAGAFTGLIAYGVFGLDSSTLKGWQILFIIEGVINFIFGAVEEHTAAIVRLMRDSTDRVDVKFALMPGVRALMDPAMWPFMLLCISYGVATTSTGQFLPQIVHRLGYNSVQTNLHLVAPNLTGCVITLLVAWLSDHYKERGAFLCLGLSFTMIGYIMTSALDPLTQTGACYAGMRVLPFVWDLYPFVSSPRLAQ